MIATELGRWAAVTLDRQDPVTLVGEGTVVRDLRGEANPPAAEAT
jgi:hypothetical protein